MEEVELLGNEEDFEVILTGDKAIARQAMMRKRGKRPRGKIATATGANATSRDEVLNRLNQITDEKVVSDLASQKKALVDTVLYLSVSAGAGTVTSVSMISNSLPKATGLRNIANGKTDKDQWLLLTGVVLQSGVAAGTADADVANTAYGALAKAISNGDFEFRINGGKHVFPKDTPCSIFNSGRTDIPVGYAKLDNPKWIQPESEMFFDIKTNAAIVALTAIRLELRGSSIITF